MVNTGAPGKSPDAADLTKLCRDVLADVVVTVAVRLARTGTQPGMHPCSFDAAGISRCFCFCFLSSSPAAAFLLPLDKYFVKRKSMVASWAGCRWVS